MLLGARHNGIVPAHPEQRDERRDGPSLGDHHFVLARLTQGAQRARDLGFDSEGGQGILEE